MLLFSPRINDRISQRLTYIYYLFCSVVNKTWVYDICWSLLSALVFFNAPTSWVVNASVAIIIYKWQKYIFFSKAETFLCEALLEIPSQWWSERPNRMFGAAAHPSPVSPPSSDSLLLLILPIHSGPATSRTAGIYTSANLRTAFSFNYTSFHRFLSFPFSLGESEHSRLWSSPELQWSCGSVSTLNFFSPSL